MLGFSPKINVDFISESRALPWGFCPAQGSQRHPKMRQFAVYIAQELFMDAKIQTMRPGWGSERGLNVLELWQSWEKTPGAASPSLIHQIPVTTSDLFSFSQKKKKKNQE